MSRNRATQCLVEQVWRVVLAKATGYSPDDFIVRSSRRSSGRVLVVSAKVLGGRGRRVRFFRRLIVERAALLKARRIKRVDGPDVWRLPDSFIRAAAEAAAS